MRLALMIAKKFIRMLLLLFAVSVFAFSLATLSPVDPLQTNVGQAALGAMSPAQIEKLEAYWGIHTPPTTRFIQWFSGILHGDWGVSLIYHTAVGRVVAEKLQYSLLLFLAAWLLSGILGYLLGLLAATHHGRAADRWIRGYCLLTASTPTFWLALMLLMIFAVYIPLFPIGLSAPIGMETGDVSILQRIRHAVLPVLALTLTGISSIALHTREKALEVLHSDYVLFAQARGETPRQIFQNHLLRNTLLPAITLQFAAISELIGGTILIEQVFSYPGLAQAAVTAGLGGDVPLLLGITLITAAIVFLGNLTADVLYEWVDPRIRRERLGR